MRKRQTESIEIVEGDTTYKKVCFPEPEYKGEYILKTPEEFYPCESGYYNYLNMKPEIWSVFDELYDYFDAEYNGNLCISV